MVGKPSDALRDVMMKLLMKAPARVEFSALKDGKEEGYDVDECMNDIYTYIWNPTIQGRKLSAAPVSYTHLDVYKRQVERRLMITLNYRINSRSKVMQK